MKSFTVHQAKTHLSELIADVEAGEDVVIFRGKDPVVRLIPASDPLPKRTFGALAGKVTVTEAFFEPLPANELAAWEK